jgi:hypothetical protein
MTAVLLPAERLALTIARAQVKRGGNPEINVTTVLVMALDRLAAAPDPIVAVLDWFVSELGYPWDFTTITKPPWLDIDALAHAWSRHDGESPEIYAETIRAETGWAE